MTFSNTRMITIPINDVFETKFLCPVYDYKRTTILHSHIIKKDFSNLNEFSLANLMKIAKSVGVEHENKKVKYYTFNELVDKIKENITFA